MLFLQHLQITDKKTCWHGNAGGRLTSDPKNVVSAVPSFSLWSLKLFVQLFLRLNVTPVMITTFSKINKIEIIAIKYIIVILRLFYATHIMIIQRAFYSEEYSDIGMGIGEKIKIS